MYLGLTGYLAGWNRTYGGTSFDYGYSAFQVSDGGYVIAGLTYSLGSGIGDVYLVKTDSAGNMLWNKTYRGQGRSEVHSVVQTSDGGYALAGYTENPDVANNDFFLVKTDSAGTLQWNKTYGGARQDYGFSLVQASDGGYVMAGNTNSFGDNETDVDSDVYLVKTDAAGTMVWNKTYGGAGSDGGRSLVKTRDGGYAIAGFTFSYGGSSNDMFLVKTDAAGTMLWNKTFGGTGYEDGYSLVQTSDTGYAIAGVTNSFGAGGYDTYLVKTDSPGAMLWNKTYGDTSDEYGFSLVQTSDGGYAITGQTYSALGIDYSDMYLLKTDFAGNKLSYKNHGGPTFDIGQSVILTNDGGVAMVGFTNSFGVGSYDVFFVKDDVAGEFGLARVDSTANTLTLYRGRNDVYWNYVRVRIWKID
jgi:hypothetical protein